MVGPKMQTFCTRIDMLKGNRCILRIRGAPVRQKLGMILEIEVVQKMKLEKKVFTKNGGRSGNAAEDGSRKNI